MGGESDDVTVWCNDFDGRRSGIDERDRHEGRRRCFCNIVLCRAILFDPSVDGVDRAPDSLGDIGCGELGVEDEADGLTFDVFGEACVGHGGGAEEVRKRFDDRTDDDAHYPATPNSSNNAPRGTLTLKQIIKDIRLQFQQHL